MLDNFGAFRWSSSNFFVFRANLLGIALGTFFVSFLLNCDKFYYLYRQKIQLP